MNFVGVENEKRLLHTSEWVTEKKAKYIVF